MPTERAATYHPLMATEIQSAMSVDFPLRGEWVAFNSPGDRIPSHGTDMLGQRFAYDFIRVDRRKGWHVHPAGSWRGNLIGFRIDECYAWGKPVHRSMARSSKLGTGIRSAAGSCRSARSASS